jgi:hypothetical protein
MKKASQKVTKGTPQAVLLSVLIHIGLFLLAGTLVVFTVVKQKQVEFEPPKTVERPKMKLKKPKVQVKKTSRPKSPNRIISKNNKAVMPQMELPEMGGLGDGLGDVVGMDMMPDFKLEESFFGSEQSIGHDLEGTFYDFNRRRDGSFVGITQDWVADKINQFFTKGWDKSVFRDVFRSPKKLYATSVPMSITRSEEAPDAFDEPESKSYLWLVHYEGKIVYPEDITFRFWSYADDIVAVRVDGEIVHLNCYYRWQTHFEEATAHHWQSRAPENRQYPIGNSRAVVGDWITLNAFESKDIEILIGENYGGIFGALLLVEVEGQEYPRNPDGQMPILPLFKTAEFSRDQIENIYMYLPPGEGTCAGGPIFNDVHDPSAVSTKEPPAVIYPPESASSSMPTNTMADLALFRTWRTDEHAPMEARYKTLMRDKAVLEDERGRQTKVLVTDLSEEDQEIIALANPPQFDLNFTKNSRQLQTREASYEGGDKQVKKWAYTFGFRARQLNDTPYYDYPLTFEYFAVGDEVEADNFILLDRQSVTFDSPASGDRREYEFKSEDEVTLQQFQLFSWGNWRGAKYGGYLIVVRDKHGHIIQHKASSEFLFDGLDQLVYVPVGRHFNRDCNRCMPPRPKKDDLPSWR